MVWGSLPNKKEIKKTGKRNLGKLGDLLPQLELCPQDHRPLSSTPARLVLGNGYALCKHQYNVVFTTAFHLKKPIIWVWSWYLRICDEQLLENLHLDQDPLVFLMWEDWEALDALLAASRNTGLWQTSGDYQLKDLKASRDVRATSVQRGARGPLPWNNKPLSSLFALPDHYQRITWVTSVSFPEPLTLMTAAFLRIGRRWHNAAYLLNETPAWRWPSLSPITADDLLLSEGREGSAQKY